jgi:hypothetical protein
MISAPQFVDQTPIAFTQHPDELELIPALQRIGEEQPQQSLIAHLRGRQPW